VRGDALVAVVEDDRDCRDLLEEELRRVGYRTKGVTNGLRLISMLTLDRPSVILLDVAMSWIDGVQLCAALKANPSYRDIPVIMISGLARPSDIERGLAAGALDYFTKPIKFDRLLARLEDIVS
jgi:CheY-like chemotaxis protein